jgi:YegS/Rv2252/BmrU family lipid kinase
MMARHIAYLLNPIAGTGNRAELEPQIIAYAQRRETGFSIHDTNREANYPELEVAIRSGQVTDVVVAGGDGSISTVASSLRHTGVRFGILPRGSGNGLAFAAGIPKHIGRALDIVYDGYADPVDGFLLNRRFSCMLSGIGFDAEVAHAFAREKTRGLSTYVRVAAGHFFRARTYPFVLTVDGRQINTEAYFISIANANQFGNQFTIAPKARLNDGLIDIVVVQKMNKLQVLIAVMHQLRFGDVREGMFRKHGILYLQASRLSLENPALAPLHIDGDPVDTSSVFEIEVIPRAFRLLQPRPLAYGSQP